MCSTTRRRSATSPAWTGASDGTRNSTLRRFPCKRFRQLHHFAGDLLLVPRGLCRRAGRIGDWRSLLPVDADVGDRTTFFGALIDYRPHYDPSGLMLHCSARTLGMIPDGNTQAAPEGGLFEQCEPESSSRSLQILTDGKRRFAALLRKWLVVRVSTQSGAG